MAQSRSEHLLGTFDVAARAIDETRPLAESTGPLLAILAKALDCKWGTYWAVDPVKRILSPINMWHAPGMTTRKLEADTKDRTLSVNEGTAGHVWRSRKPVWTTDIWRDMCLPRSLDAMAAGLQGGVWFALKTDAAVYAVVELLGEDLPEAHEELLLALEVFGIRLGKIIESRST